EACVEVRLRLCERRAPLHDGVAGKALERGALRAGAVDEQRPEQRQCFLMASLEHQAFGLAAPGLEHERLGADLAEQAERLVELRVCLLEAASARRDAAEVRGREGNSDAVAGIAPSADRLREQRLCLVEPALVG